MKRPFSAEAFHSFVDWFIHPSMLEDKTKRKQARLFLMSHL